MLWQVSWAKLNLSLDVFFLEGYGYTGLQSLADVWILLFKQLCQWQVSKPATDRHDG